MKIYKNVNKMLNNKNAFQMDENLNIKQHDCQI